MELASQLGPTYSNSGLSGIRGGVREGEGEEEEEEVEDEEEEMGRRDNRPRKDLKGENEESM